MFKFNLSRIFLITLAAAILMWIFNPFFALLSNLNLGEVLGNIYTLEWLNGNYSSSANLNTTDNNVTMGLFISVFLTALCAVTPWFIFAFIARIFKVEKTKCNILFFICFLYYMCIAYQLFILPLIGNWCWATFGGQCFFINYILNLESSFWGSRSLNLLPMQEQIIRVVGSIIDICLMVFFVFVLLYAFTKAWEITSTHKEDVRDWQI